MSKKEYEEFESCCINTAIDRSFGTGPFGEYRDNHASFSMGCVGDCGGDCEVYFEIPSKELRDKVRAGTIELWLSGEGDCDECGTMCFYEEIKVSDIDYWEKERNCND